MTKLISIGKYRGLQQCSTHLNTISILALDHRNNLRQIFHPDEPETTTPEELVAFKQEVVENLSPLASAVLLDPEFGAAQAIARRSLSGTAGLVVAIESTGYGGDPFARESNILPGWSVKKSRRMGASAIKLLVYYHPQGPTANEVEQLVCRVAESCVSEDIAFFLEPLSYSVDPDRKKLSSDERRNVVIETARRLSPLGADILKVEFPVDISTESNQLVWAEACSELNQASAIPWVLLSASVDYEDYVRQVTTACCAGSSGIAVGRAVWKEAAECYGEERSGFLRETAQGRIERLTALCNGLANPWTSFYFCPPITQNWYQDYSEPRP